MSDKVPTNFNIFTQEQKDRLTILAQIKNLFNLTTLVRKTFLDMLEENKEAIDAEIARRK